VIGRFAAVAVLVVLGTVAAWRASEVVGVEPAFAAHGERTWMAWSLYRDDADQRLGAVAARLDGEECVSVVVGAEEPTWWWHAMALYHLRRHRVIEVRHAGEPDAETTGCAVVEQRPDGDFEIVERTPG
jgi:hypothetical protein